MSKPKILWLQGLTCNGNTHSFLNHPQLRELFDAFEFLYHPILPCTQTLETMVTCKDECDILIFEGTYDPKMLRADVRLETLVAHYSNHASSVIAVGSCASFGGMFQSVSPERNSGLAFNGDARTGPIQNSVINLSGCPIHPEWLGFTLRMLLHKREILLDDLLRPQELYSYLAHHGCTRNEYFEWKVDAKAFGLKEGCLYYDQGCRGPMTHASCNKILWNDVSSKTRVGTPCFGCTEPDFPRSEMFTTKTNMSVPLDVPLGISKRTYLTVAGIAKTFKIRRLEERLIDDH
ncbi:MAG: hydrogenase [Campylobacterota bacterium]|nr:hydrogenase [Campylobacterota bacterium]